MKAILLFTSIIALSLAAKIKQGSSMLCGLASLQSKIQCGNNQYLSVKSASFGVVTDTTTCPITMNQQCVLDISKQLQDACNYKAECNILPQHYQTFDYYCEENTATDLALSYACEEETGVAEQLFAAFNNKRGESNLQPAKWNEEYVSTAKAELQARLQIEGGFSNYRVFEKHERLDGVAKEQKTRTEGGIRYMMEFVAKLGTSNLPATTAITEWVSSRNDDYKNMLYEFDLGGAACDNYGNGWVCVLHAVKLM